MDIEGYSVAKVQRPLDIERFYVYRNDTFVASISRSTYTNKPGFDWHDKFMWKFKAADFVS